LEVVLPSGTSPTGAEALSPRVREIQTLFLDELAIRVESPNADLVATGLLDSAAIVQLIVELERRFGISLPVAELGIDSFQSVTRIAAMVDDLKQLETARPPAKISHKEVMSAVAGLLLATQSVRVDSFTTDLFKSGQLDSMALVQLIVDLEERFGVQLPMEQLELESFHSVAAMAEVVLSRLP
jgi:D-alanine--poly(phosphoribitol) ligase subunit 2